MSDKIKETAMSEERRQILAMLAEGKISVEEAERLLEALSQLDASPDKIAGHEESTERTGRKKPKYLSIRVNPKRGEGKAGEESEEGGHRHHRHRGERVNIKVPLFLLRTGLKLKGILPDEIKEKINSKLGEKGINLGDLDDEAFEELIQGLTELSIEVDDEDEQIRIGCE